LTIPNLDPDGSLLYTGDYNSNGSYAPAKIMYKDGTVRYFRTTYNNFPYNIVTPNGNYIIGDFNGNPAIDTLGRSIALPSIPYSGTACVTLTDSNGNPQIYSITATSLTVTNPINNLQETRGGYITSITLPNGKSYTFEYNNVNGYMTKMTLPSGAYVRYTYNSQYVANRYVSADGTPASEKTWTYLGAGNVNDPEGGRIVVTNNAQGLGTSTQWQRFDGTNWITDKEVRSNWSSNGVESNGQPVNPKVDKSTTVMGTKQASRTLMYDSSMNVILEQHTDWGNNADGPLLISKGRTFTTLSAPFQRQTSETVSFIDPVTNQYRNQKTEFFYDQYALAYSGPSPTGTVPNSGNYPYPMRGNLTRIRQYKNEALTAYIEIHTHYDPLGNVAKKVDALGHTTLLDWSDNFTDSVNRNAFAYLNKTTNPLNHFTTTKYDYNTGLPKQVTDPRGFTTTTAYDGMSRVTSLTEPNGKQTTYSYDDNNRITTRQVTVDNAGNVGQVKTYFDRLYRVVQTRTNDPEGEIWVDMVYDAKGRKKQVSNPLSRRRLSGLDDDKL
jgi:YD repeat-containing protein